MYLYWRIQQDLNCLGEVIHFHDPAFINALQKWVRKNFYSLARVEGFYPDKFKIINGISLINRN